MTTKSPKEDLMDHPVQAKRRALRGITLIELMVAMALGAILIGIVTFVWLQAQGIFSRTTHRLQTYQRLRTVLDLMERDLANTNRTVDMEFFDDTDPDGNGSLLPNGHFETDESVMKVDGQIFRVPRDPLDPLTPPPAAAGEPDVFGEEFGISGFPPDPVKGGNAFIYAATVLSRPPYKINAGYTDNRAYWDDEVYVRSYALIDGENRRALIHYRLVRMANRRSVLRRRIWCLDENYKITPETDRVSILAHGICDLKIGFYFKESTIDGVGNWYHVGDREGNWNEDGKALLAIDEARGIRPARGGSDIESWEPLSSQHENQFGEMNAVSFVLSGNARIEDQVSGGVVLRALDDGDDLTAAELAAGEEEAYSQFNFPGVRPGDKIYIYDATDDDPNQATGATREASFEDFPDREFTVEAIYSDYEREHVSIKFREQINFFRIKRRWLGDESTSIQLDEHSEEGGPPRKVRRSFNVKYRVGFLPAAFLLRLSCDDQYNRQVLTMERVIRLLQQ